MATSNNYQFIPAYYEWHLIDEQGEVLHNMADPVEGLFDENGEALTLESIKEFCEGDLLCAENAYRNDYDYNGIRLKESLTDEQIKAAVEVMAEALYNYYVA